MKRIHHGRRCHASRVRVVALALALGLSLAHAHDVDPVAAAATDITNRTFANRSADCADYAGSLASKVADIKEGRSHKGAVRITAGPNACSLQSNNIPNHDFNDHGARFIMPVAEVAQEFSIPRAPKMAAEPIRLTHRAYHAVMLNGVVVDILSAGCYRPNGRSPNAAGNVMIGCQPRDAWVLDPLGPGAGFGTDAHNAHVQPPNGLYHYHGNPMAMFDDKPGPNGSPLIGWAADGFPIYGSYFRDSSGKVRKAVSGYTLRAGQRPKSATDPGGPYDGMYVDDHVFTGAGDLDACNGMTVGGQYGYYVTDAYPWILSCLAGTPDATFDKRR